MDPSPTRNISIDSLSRDPVGGAYHCPTCGTPFTRRSNLRRHYTIHTRNIEFTCPGCGKSFACSDELNYHTFQCSAAVRNEAADRMFHTMALESSDHLDYQPIDFLNIPTRLPSTQFPPNFNLTADPFCREVPFSRPQDEHNFSEFLSSLACSGNSTERLEDSSPSNLSNSPTPPIFSRKHETAGCPRHGVSGRGKVKEKPIYTRQQVNDMLDAVSSCFVKTIEEVLGRAGTQGQSHLCTKMLRDISVPPAPPSPRPACGAD